MGTIKYELVPKSASSWNCVACSMAAFGRPGQKNNVRYVRRRIETSQICTDAVPWLKEEVVGSFLSHGITRTSSRKLQR